MRPPDERMVCERCGRRQRLPHARRLALRGLQVQDRLLRLVARWTSLATRIARHERRVSARTRPPCNALVDQLREAEAKARAGRRGEVARTASSAGKTPGARAARLRARSRFAVSGALAAGRLGHVRRRRAGRGHRHRHRPRRRARGASSSPTTPRSRAAPTTPSPSRSTCGRSRSRSRTGCRASTSSIRAARSCRCRPRSSPIAITSGASSINQARMSARAASRRSPSSWARAPPAARYVPAMSDETDHRQGHGHDLPRRPAAGEGGHRRRRHGRRAGRRRRAHAPLGRRRLLRRRRRRTRSRSRGRSCRRSTRRSDCPLDIDDARRTPRTTSSELYGIVSVGPAAVRMTSAK